MKGRDVWPNPFMVLVGLLLYLSMTPAERRAMLAIAERRVDADDAERDAIKRFKRARRA